MKNKIKNEWYNKNLKKYFSKNVEKWIAWTLWVLIVFFWNYFSWDTWKWENLEPIKVTIITYWVSSAITFVTTWALFYYLRIYQFLHILFVRWLWLKKLYKDIKYFIWGALNLFTIFIFVPIIITFINIICTILYNLYTLLVYLFPSFIIILTIVGLYYLYKFLKDRKNIFTK